MGDSSESSEDLTSVGSIGARVDAALRRSGIGVEVSRGRVDEAREAPSARNRTIQSASKSRFGCAGIEA